MAASIFERQPRDSAVARDSARMFQGIRLRLTLWYTGVLALALLLFGVALYLGVRQAAVGPIEDRIHTSADALAADWRSSPQFPCPAPELDFDHSVHHFCYIPGSKTPVLVSRHDLLFVEQATSFTDTSIIPDAIHEGTQTDTVPSPYGTLERYAVAVRDPQGRTLGVVVVGAEVGHELNALHVLLTLLIGLGLVTLVGAAGGGLFLASRALAPARLAYARQRDFIADASHELRTPLSILRADAEVLLRGKDHLPPDDVQLLEDMVSEAGHMARLADNMLDLARLDTGRMRLEQEVIDLGAMGAEMAHRVIPLAAERGVTVRQEIEPDVLIIGDRLLLQQAVLILVDNAIKYNRTGGDVVVRVFARGEQAFLEVRDSGIGIESEHLSRLGERFYRVDRARSRQMGGAGLGVPIAHSIAVRHGGSLEIRSEAGQGTSAVLLLPSAGTASTRRPS